MSAAPQLEPGRDAVTVAASPATWSVQDLDGATLHFAGDAGFAIPAARAAKASANPLDGVNRFLADAPGFGAGILSWGGRALAFTDHCRSTPVFYAAGNHPVAGGDAHAVRDAAGLGGFSDDAALTAATAGYIAGTDTLVDGLKQVRPGEAVLWTSDSAPEQRRTFAYTPSGVSGDGDALTAVIDNAIDRVIAAAGDAPVWVPLSGGLDSRLILAKLVARGCPNLHSFSYGPRGNDDAMVAREIAARLDVPWQFVATPPADVRKFFESETRRAYWRDAGGLCATPNNQDLLPLIRLRESGALSDDAMIVNGQTGDFISGGHVPDALFDNAITVDGLLDRIIDRHHALWCTLLTGANRERLKEHIRETLALTADGGDMLEPPDAIALWERYEYEGRQAEYIVNGERIYDFLGLRWALPLWDGEVVRFWRDAAPAHKRGQKLYRETWEAWDHAGVFSLPTRKVTAWSRPVSAVLIPASIATRLVAGRARRDRWITYARYFDRFGNHYQAFGWRRFRQHAADARNPLSYYTRAWFDELGVPWPEGAVQP